MLDCSIRVVKVINKGVVYKGANGKEYTNCNYYNVIKIGDKETWVAIRPSFSKGYQSLDFVAETIVNSEKVKEK